MNRFHNITGLDVRELAPWELQRRGYPRNEALYELRMDMAFNSDIANGTIVVPQGFLTNDANIPALARPLLNSNAPVISLGAVLHDYLYSLKGWITEQRKISRDQADRILAFEAMPALGATAFQQHAVYRALKYFGDRWP